MATCRYVDCPHRHRERRARGSSCPFMKMIPKFKCLVESLISCDDCDFMDNVDKLKQYVCNVDNISEEIHAFPQCFDIFLQLFSSLSDSDKLEETASVFLKIFEHCSLNISSDTYIPVIIKGLHHTLLCVQKVSLKTLLRMEPATLNLVLKHENVLDAFLSAAVGDLSLLKIANDFLCKYIQLLSPSDEFWTVFLFCLKKLYSSNKVQQYRIYSLLMDCARCSEDALRKFIDDNLFDELLNDLNDNDVLIKINALDVLSSLTLCPLGVRLLKQNNTLSKLITILVEKDSDPFFSLTLPALLRVFVGICQINPELVKVDYPQFFVYIFESIKNEFSDISLSMLGFIAKSTEGKLILESESNNMRMVCQSLASLLEDTAVDKRILALNVMSNLFSIQSDSKSNRLLALTESWYHFIIMRDQSTLLHHLMKLLKEPFPDMHFALLSVILSLSTHDWAIDLFHSQAQFIEYFLSRNTESSAEDKLSKYNIVCCILQHPCTRSIFGDSDYFKLAAYKKEGPYFVITEPNVAVDEY